MTDKKPMEILMFTGPNGAGKTTIAGEYVKVNNIGLDYVNPDIYEKKFFSHVQDYIQRIVAAADYALEVREQNLANRQSFMFETVVTEDQHEWLKLGYVKRAIEQGATLNSVIVLNRDVSVSLARNLERISQGGHGVPEDTIRRRYDIFMGLLPEIIKLSKSATIYDNTDKPTIIGKKQGNSIDIIGDDIPNDEWLQRTLVNPLSADQDYTVRLLGKSEGRDRFTECFARGIKGIAPSTAKQADGNGKT